MHISIEEKIILGAVIVKHSNNEMLYQQTCIYMHMGYLCGITQIGLTEQLLYLGISLTICTDQGQLCSHWYGDYNVHSCH